MYENRGKALLSVSKKEAMDNVRSKWVLVLTLIFAGLILLISAYEGTRPGSNGGFENVIAFSSSLVVMLISIVAIVMGYKTVVKEVDSKSIALLLTSELSRKDIIFGKFVGLFTVIGFSIVTGLGIGGIVIGLTSGFENAGLYVIYILLSLVFGAAYLSISMMLSSFFSKKSRALAGGVFIWIFFTFIWDLLLFVGLIGSGWDMPSSPTESVTYPEWYDLARLFNPNHSFTMLVNKVIEPAIRSATVQIGSGTPLVPEIITTPMALTALVTWIIIPIAIGVIWFNRKDL